MRGLTQSWPLTVDRILDHARSWRPKSEVAARSAEGRVDRVSYADLNRRARRLSQALSGLGVVKGDSVAVIGSNSLRQVEAWYAIAGMGAVCHPLNPRLTADQLSAFLRAGEDKAVLIDPDLLGGLENTLSSLPSRPAIVVMADAAHMPASGLELMGQDALVAETEVEASWGGLDENDPAVLLHTLGATGAPRTVVWSHRAAALSALIAKGADALDLSADDSVAALMPFARAGGFGLIFSTPAAGARLILPGPRTDSPSVHALLENEKATFALASPSDVQGLFDHLLASGGRLTSLRRIVAAGGQCPPTLARDFKDRFGVQVLTAWGLAETAGLGAVSDVAGALRPPFGLEVEVTDSAGNTLPRDSAAIGRVRVRGASAASGYLGDAGEALDPKGFLDTGDLGAIDPEGRLRITDRAAEIINAGGQWISPRAIELAALEHPATAEAAVIAYPDGAGAERPLLIVRRRPGGAAGKAEYLAYLQRRLPRGQIPFDVLFVDGLPLDAVGRIDKRTLRERLERHRARAEGRTTEPAAASALAAATGPVLYAPAPPPPDPEPVRPGPAQVPEAAVETAVEQTTPEVQAEPQEVDDTQNEAAAPPVESVQAASEGLEVQAEAPVAAVAPAAYAGMLDWSTPASGHDGEGLSMLTGQSESDEIAPATEGASAPAEPAAADDETISLGAAQDEPVAPTIESPAEPEPAAPATEADGVPVDDGEILPPAPPALDADAPAPVTESLDAEAKTAAPGPVETPLPEPVARIVDESAADADDAPLMVTPVIGGPRGKRRGKSKASTKSASAAPASKARPNRAAARYLNLALAFSLLPLLVIAGGIVAIRLGQVDPQFGVEEILAQWPFRLAMVGVVTGLVGLFVALFTGFGRVWRRAVLGLAIPVLTIAGLIAVQSRAESQPPIHDVSSDWADPVVFSPALVALRGPGANALAADPYVPAGERLFAGRRVADVNAETCPGARTVRTTMDSARALASAQAAASKLGWSPVGKPADGRLEATATSAVLGLQDDVAVRVRPDGAGARIDARSVSRLGQADHGRNCVNVTRLLKAVGG